MIVRCGNEDENFSWEFDKDESVAEIELATENSPHSQPVSDQGTFLGALPYVAYSSLGELVSSSISDQSVCRSDYSSLLICWCAVHYGHLTLS